MRALVTGANGLIGANLVRELLRDAVDVRGLVRHDSDLSALRGIEIELHRGDVTKDPTALIIAARDCDLIFHTAMHFSYESRRYDEINAAATLGTENVLRAARAANVGRVVVTSSSVVFGHSLSRSVRNESSPAVDEADNVYVEAKKRQHRLALGFGEALGLDVVAVCPTVSVGPFSTALGPSNGHILAYLADPYQLSYPGGCNIVSTADIATGHWLAARHGVRGAHYILGAENLEWREFHGLVADLAGVEAPRFNLNHGLSYLAATAEEIRARMTHRAPLSNRAQAKMVGRYYWYDHSLAADALGYQPRSARRALAEALSWLVASRHVSRELRARLRLHEDVYAGRYPIPPNSR